MMAFASSGSAAVTTPAGHGASGRCRGLGSEGKRRSALTAAQNGTRGHRVPAIGLDLAAYSSMKTRYSFAAGRRTLCGWRPHPAPASISVRAFDFAVAFLSRLPFIWQNLPVGVWQTRCPPLAGRPRARWPRRARACGSAAGPRS